MQPRTPWEQTRETWRLRPGFGVVVSLGERDWTNILQEEEADTKDFSHQLFLGFLCKLKGRDPFRFALRVLCLLLVQRLLSQGDSEVPFSVN